MGLYYDVILIHLIRFGNHFSSCRPLLQLYAVSKQVVFALKASLLIMCTSFHHVPHDRRSKIRGNVNTKNKTRRYLSERERLFKCALPRRPSSRVGHQRSHRMIRCSKRCLALTRALNLKTVCRENSNSISTGAHRCLASCGYGRLGQATAQQHGSLLRRYSRRRPDIGESVFRAKGQLRL